MHFNWRDNEDAGDCEAMNEADASEFFGGGDPRRCPHHPNERTSSDDGMHDSPCGICEVEMEASDGCDDDDDAEDLDLDIDWHMLDDEEDDDLRDGCLFVDGSQLARGED